MSCEHTLRDDCALCKALRTGRMTKAAIQILNQRQAPKPEMRECGRCKGKFEKLVTREGVVMCEECATELDEDA